jgi:tripartite-type tricarboxylate transporter receptor subunit TctC
MKAAFSRWPLAAAFMVLAWSQAAWAQTWPTRPIKMVVPFAAGGSVDITGRVLARALSARLGQGIIVENRAGAAGIPGTDYVSKAAPDGYTIVLASAGIVAIGPHIYKNMPFDPIKGLLPVTPVVEGINVVVVNTSNPVKSLKEFIALAKASPGKINFGSSGVGASDDMATELFANMTGTKMTNIAYKGGGPAIIDLLAGNIDVIFSAVAPAIGQIKAGRLRPLAVTSSQRLQTLPDVPTVAEAGVPGYESVAWYGLFAPIGTPADIVRKLNTETAAALQNKDVSKQLIEAGLVPSSSSPEAFATYVAAETVKWGKLVSANGIKVE